MSFSLPSLNPLDSWNSQGCFRIGDLEGNLHSSSTFQTSLLCESNCERKAFVGITGTSCYCGDSLSGESVDISNCGIVCNSQGLENCGGDGYVFVYQNNTPEKVDDPESLVETLTATTVGTTSRLLTFSLATLTRTSLATEISSLPDSLLEQVESTSSELDSSLLPSTSQQLSATTVVSTFFPNSQSTAVITSIILASQSINSSPTESVAPAPTSKSVSAGTIAGAVVGSVAGLLLILAIILFFLYRRRKNNDDDIEDDFILSGPKKMEQTPNPFLLAGGYKFDNNQNDHFIGVPSSSSDDSTYGHSRQTSQAFNDQSLDNFYYDEGNQLSRPKIGSRKLSIGSLPDIRGNNRSLKVVNGEE